MLIPDDYAQANFIHGGLALPFGAQCTLGLNVELIPGTRETAAENVSDAWLTYITPLMDSAVTHIATLVKFGPNDVGPSYEIASGGTGGATGDASPPNLSVLVRKNTGVGGRTGRGRMYVPGMTDGNLLDGGVIGSSVVSDWQQGFDDFFDALGASGIVPALLHDEDSPVSAPYIITSFSVQARAATQRQRLRR